MRNRMNSTVAIADSAMNRDIAVKQATKTWPLGTKINASVLPTQLHIHFMLSRIGESIGCIWQAQHTFLDSVMNTGGETKTVETEQKSE